MEEENIFFIKLNLSQAPETLDSLDVIELKLLFLAPGVYDRRWSRW